MRGFIACVDTEVNPFAKHDKNILFWFYLSFDLAIHVTGCSS